ncbi:MAG: FtsW/RodA/SpoVE family cell cycle protein [Lachnospiraceae bacterium]|nr:FtsW/RodA/SpoVE family cell cycle protein [Lachnospiraceae bacterium]
MFDFNLKNYGFLQLIVCVALNIAGLIFVQSSVGERIYSFMSQLGISIASLIICLLISFLNLKKVMPKYYWFFAISVFALLLVQITGTAYGRNSIRWIRIPFVNMEIQPSEFAKLFLILFSAKYMEKLDIQINQFGNLFKLFIFYFIPFLLIFIQPNLSSSLIFTTIFVAMLFASKLKFRWFLIFGGIFALIFILVYSSVRFGFIDNIPFLRDYQKNRIESFFIPTEKNEAQYQQENSVIAIGSGKVTGKGINNDSPNSVKNGNWLAEAQNDFIFAVVGEEVGFVGSVIIILLYVFLIISCIVIASKQREYYKNLICIGVAAWLAIQTFINIGVATSLIPNTGVPLPFFSQGGSSLLSIYMGIGFVLNIRRETRV